MNSNRRVMRTKLRGSLAVILTAFCAGSAAAVLLLILGYVMRAGLAAINPYLRHNNRGIMQGESWTGTQS
jgi:hypothetical protein